MKVSFVGMSGSGKSSIGKLINERFNLPYFSMGNAVREIMSNLDRKSDLDIAIRQHLDSQKWKPLPDSLAVTLFESIVARQQNYIIDGFPRSIDQYNPVNLLIEKVVYFDVDYQTSYDRVMRRRRSQDNHDNWKLRLEYDQKRLPPLIEQLQSEAKIIIVNAQDIKSNVYRQIVNELKII